jgi:hypothetical protein
VALPLDHQISTGIKIKPTGIKIKPPVKETHGNVINGQKVNLYYRNQLYNSCSALDLMQVTYEDEYDVHRCCHNCQGLQNQLNSITAELIAIKSQLSSLIDSKAEKCDIFESPNSNKRTKRNKKAFSQDKAVEAQNKSVKEISDQKPILDSPGTSISPAAQVGGICTQHSYRKNEINFPKGNALDFTVMKTEYTSHMKNVANVAEPTMSTMPTVSTLSLTNKDEMEHQKNEQMRFSENDTHLVKLSGNLSYGEHKTCSPSSELVSNHCWNEDMTNAYKRHIANKKPIDQSDFNCEGNIEVYQKVDENYANDGIFSTNQCLIIKGLPESSDIIPKNRLKHDLSQLQSCTFPLLQGDESLEICKAFRLGKYETSKFPRPLKIILRSEDQRDLLLSKKSILRNYSPHVFFQREYSPKERQKYRDLYQLMKSRLELGETSLIIRNGEIVKRNNSFLWSTPVKISRLTNNI